ncbi:HAD family hydrolase [Pseudoalteromonas ulvae]|uniref:Phosphatase n=1 Tax=Pseudoalteromonas ulvae TaxID=107327 RepID=A0A244CR11_PSEDV|nr:HAD family hydrolase [Pseudoalteromonas ulvae]OUL58035.1 phosphatase [Pseudoalteromonas ulvae]
MIDISKIRGFIFDLDGTLVSSKLNFSLIKKQISCPANQDLLTFIANIECQQQQAAALANVHKHELEDAHDAVILPGVLELLTSLEQKGLPTAIVTRNYRQAAQIKMRNNQIKIDTLITRDDAPAKPDPSALLQLASQWQIPTQELIYVGDYLYDIDAAINANMRSCLYAEGDLPDYAHKADVVINHFKQLTDKLN